ncbi:hypothetical protein [Clostridium sp. ZBS15]|uniref:hypothetical protein n=1 Tax=Clostridium sp. ZBS15 TaxID=2949969 RepID=UPI00207967AD|nr:hypothetical protein [Clostridium sp. ZBS15]
MVIKGKGVFKDGIDTDELEIKGKLYSDGNINIEKLTVKGKVECKSCLNSRTIDSKGSLNIQDSIKAEECKLYGSVNTNTLEVKKNIKWEFSGDSVVKEFLFNEAKITKDNGESKTQLNNLLSFVLNKKIELDFSDNKSDSLQIAKAIGKEIFIEDCTIDELICDNAEIGHNCVVKKLKCSGKYSVAEDSQVNII